MANDISYEQASKAIEEGAEAIIAKESRAYACGYLKGILQNISIMFPEAREEIIYSFKLFIDGTAELENNK